DLVFGCWFVWLVDRAARGPKDPFGRFLELRSMRFIGQISYSIYIPYNFLPILFNRFFDKFGFEWHDEVSTLWQMCVLFLASIAVATMTWYFLEQPIRRMRDRFEKSSTPGLSARSQATGT